MNNEQSIEPNNAQCHIDGMYYKIGVNNLVFRHNGFNWVSSTKSIEDVRKRIYRIQKLEQTAERRRLNGLKRSKKDYVLRKEIKKIIY